MSTSNETKIGSIYMVWTPDMRDNVRKIWVSTDAYDLGVDRYGTERVVYASAIVSNPYQCMRKLKQAFDDEFTLVNGDEAYKGCVVNMTIIFTIVIASHLKESHLKGTNPKEQQSVKRPCVRYDELDDLDDSDDCNPGADPHVDSPCG